MRGKQARMMAVDDASHQPLTEMQRRAKRMRLEALRAKLLEDPGLPTPEQAARGCYERVTVKEPDKAEQRLVLKNTAGNTLDRWHKKGLITDRQWAAADRYRSLYLRAGLNPQITSRYGADGGGRSGEPSYAGTLPATISQLMARDDWRLARSKVPGSIVARFDDIVLHEIAPRALDGETGGRERVSIKAIEWVRIGGDELAEFYKISRG